MTDADTLALLIRPYKGFTQKLRSYASFNPDISLSAHLDGPYGGCSRRVENVYESIILVSGGSGITPSLAWLAYLAPRMAAGGVATTSIRLV
jgi:predicted ferric reductase